MATADRKLHPNEPPTLMTPLPPQVQGDTSAHTLQQRAGWSRGTEDERTEDNKHQQGMRTQPPPLPNPHPYPTPTPTQPPPPP